MAISAPPVFPVAQTDIGYADGIVATATCLAGRHSPPEIAGVVPQFAGVGDTDRLAGLLPLWLTKYPDRVVLAVADAVPPRWAIPMLDPRLSPRSFVSVVTLPVDAASTRKRAFVSDPFFLAGLAVSLILVVALGGQRGKWGSPTWDIVMFSVVGAVVVGTTFAAVRTRVAGGDYPTWKRINLVLAKTGMCALVLALVLALSTLADVHGILGTMMDASAIVAGICLLGSMISGLLWLCFDHNTSTPTAAASLVGAHWAGAGAVDDLITWPQKPEWRSSGTYLGIGFGILICSAPLIKLLRSISEDGREFGGFDMVLVGAGAVMTVIVLIVWAVSVFSWRSPSPEERAQFDRDLNRARGEIVERVRQGNVLAAVELSAFDQRLSEVSARSGPPRVA